MHCIGSKFGQFSSDSTCSSSKFDHQLAPPALVPNLTNMHCNWHWFQFWPPGGTTCIATLPWIVLLISLSCYLKQPESHQSSFNKVSEFEKIGSLNRTRDTWIDKNHVKLFHHRMGRVKATNIFLSIYISGDKISYECPYKAHHIIRNRDPCVCFAACTDVLSSGVIVAIS